jgi:hypothetical protein
MRLTPVFVATLILASVSGGHAQETTFGYRVRIHPADHRLMVADDSTCSPVINGLRNDACSINGRASYYRPARDDEKVTGAASIHRDAQDPSLLHVNFFTFRCSTAAGGTAGARTEAVDTPTGCQSQAGDINARKYAMKFSNRQYETFWSRGWHLKLLAIPLKARFAYQSDTLHVPSRAEAAVNGNLFAGYRIGQEKFFYERGAARNPYTQFHITPGVFIGASSVTVGAATSRTALVPQTTDVPTAVVSGGVGLMAGLRNFSLGAFLGLDHAWGEVGNKWDYQHRPFLGIGITLDAFWDGARL